MSDPEPYIDMPILKNHSEGTAFPDFVRIPMRCQSQAIINHNQTLARLKKRGGLAPSEAVAIMRLRKWEPFPTATLCDYFIRFGWGMK